MHKANLKKLNLKKHVTPKRMRIALLVALGLVLAGVLLDLAVDSVVHSRKEVMVPDFKGKSLQEAIAMTSTMNLGIKKEGDEYAQNLPAGTVLRQSPLPGMTVKEGKLIKVTLSRGGEVLFVPDLIDQPVRSAEISIRQAGLALGEEGTRFSLKIAKGYVVAQDPPANAIADKDSVVNVVISAGKPPDGIMLVPDFAGKAADDVIAWGGANKITVLTSEEAQSVVAPGCVIRQNPAPDQEVSRGGTISVVLAAGGTTHTLPALGKKIYYEIPQGGDMRQVRITVLDDAGEREVFNAQRPPGSKIEVSVSVKGEARARIFINGILVEQTDIK